ncbi:hypothetical protein ACFU53_41100 [Streptomyces sp. NPDC057474]|uniref:hypothetical protein n=1 Tax=Streptomyces sp. NPDC057474 TaxID=3346144 RepID=UPI0036A675E5
MGEPPKTVRGARLNGLTPAQSIGTVAGLHLFTFSQIAETEAWRRALLERIGG